MERLTRNDMKIGFIDSRTLPSYQGIYERLRTYEDLEESGRLVKLPCAVGDTVYAVTSGFISELCVNRICVLGNSAQCDWTMIYGIYPSAKGFRADEIGKTVFLTRAEAEEKLRQRQ